MFIAALRWLAARTTYYALAAEHLRADLLLYPVRQGYHLHFMKKTGRYSADFMSEIVAAMGGRVDRTIGTIINANRASHVGFGLPVFSAWLTRATGDVREVIPAALELRNDDALVEARGQLKEIRVLFDSEEVPEASAKAQKLLKDVDAVLATIRRKFGIETAQGPTVTTAVKVLNPALAIKGIPPLPEIGKGKLIPLKVAENWPRRGVGALYRDITRDLSQYPRLGEIRDLLGAAVDTETHKAMSSVPKVEQPEFRHVRSDWKIPM